MDEAAWREDLQAVQFQPAGHRGHCVVHRLAFRTLVGRLPTLADCLAFFAAHEEAFRRAAAEKRQRRSLSEDANFHLNSRDIRRHLGLLPP